MNTQFVRSVSNCLGWVLLHGLLACGLEETSISNGQPAAETRAISASDVPYPRGTNGHYYEYVAVQQTWDQALAWAASRVPMDVVENGITTRYYPHLHTETSAEESDFVLRQVNKTDQYPFWIGAHDRNVECHRVNGGTTSPSEYPACADPNAPLNCSFASITGETSDPVQFEDNNPSTLAPWPNWAFGYGYDCAEPNAHQLNQYCAMMVSGQPWNSDCNVPATEVADCLVHGTGSNTSPAMGEWGDYRCDSLLPFIIEYTPTDYRPFPLSVTVTGSGTVTSSPAGIQCTAGGVGCVANFAAGAVTLNATPATGYMFEGWSGACTGTSTTCTLTLLAAEEVSAKFKAKYVLSVYKTGTGTGTVVSVGTTGINCGSDCSEIYSTITSVTLKATVVLTSANRFVGWTGACNTTSAYCTVNVNAVKSATAQFQYDATLDADGDGYNKYVDCNDRSATTYPGAPEIPKDGKDNDCDGKIDEV
jgi:uncharacterized repeat protein (TIGR02543 family)